MEKYINACKQMFIRWKDFDGKTNKEEFWNAMLCVIVAYIVINLLSFIPAIGFIFSILNLIVFVPMLAMSIRRLRDVGEDPLNILWLLLPLIGLIILILKWIKPSKA